MDDTFGANSRSSKRKGRRVKGIGETNLQLIHPVLTFGLLVLTLFALGLEDAVEVADAVGSVEFEVEGVLVEEARTEEEIDGLLEVAIASVVALGVAGVLVDAGETLLLL